MLQQVLAVLIINLKQVLMLLDLYLMPEQNS
jgi:hypothetical protein